MTAVIVEFNLVSQGSTRQAVFDRLDEAALAVFDHVGGAPWEMIDDDIKRVGQSNLTLADDQGYIYHGIRRYIYRGPFLGGPGITFHEGYKLQNGVPSADESSS